MEMLNLKQKMFAISERKFADNREISVKLNDVYNFRSARFVFHQKAK